MRSLLRISPLFAIGAVVAMLLAIMSHTSDADAAADAFGLAAFVLLIAAVATSLVQPEVRPDGVAIAWVGPIAGRGDVVHVLGERGARVVETRTLRDVVAASADVVALAEPASIWFELLLRVAAWSARSSFVVFRSTASPFAARIADGVVPIQTPPAAAARQRLVAYVARIDGRSTAARVEGLIAFFATASPETVASVVIAGDFDDVSVAKWEKFARARLAIPCEVVRASASATRARLLASATAFVTLDASSVEALEARIARVPVLVLDASHADVAELLAGLASVEKPSTDVAERRVVRELQADYLVQAAVPRPPKISFRYAPMILAIVALSWPFLTHLGSFLAVRYFDANTVFGADWMTGRLFHGWDEQEHLGYSHSREFAYLSVQQLIAAAMAPLGPDAINRISLIATQLGIFGAMYGYVRMTRPRAGLLIHVLAAYVYAANPFVVAFIHDGYSGLLVSYALFPALLMLIEWAKRTHRPAVVIVVPLAFIATGMYSLTGAVISMAGIALVEFRWIVAALRNRRILIATILAFFVNLYWFVPAIVSVILTASPLLQESAGDIAVLTTFGTLSNALLLRSYPELSLVGGTGIPECTSCGFYFTAWYEIAAGALVVGALAVLFRLKRVYFYAALTAIAFTTGFHYYQEVIGIPYAVLMHLPTFDTFRSSVKFTALTAFFVSIAIVESSRFLLARRLALTALTIAVAVTALPYWTGRLIEDNPTKAFPNFVVNLPDPYGNAKSMDQLRELISPEQTTMLVPAFNGGLAATTWGQFGNDLLPPILQRPTLSKWYVTQPNRSLDNIIDVIDDPNITAPRAQSLLRSLGIDWTIVRRDVLGAKPLDPETFGTMRYNRFAFSAVHRMGPSLARYFSMEAPVPVLTLPINEVVDTALYSGITARMAVAGGSGHESTDMCRGKAPIAFAQGYVPSGDRTIVVKVPCRGKFTISAFLPAGSDPPILLFSRYFAVLNDAGDLGTGYHVYRSDPFPIDSLTEVAMTVRASPKVDMPFLQLERSGSEHGMRVETPVQNILGFFYQPADATRYVVFNKSWDRALAGVSYGSEGVHLAAHPVIDGFANGWIVDKAQHLWVFDAVTATIAVFAPLSLVFLLLSLGLVGWLGRSRVPLFQRF